MMSHPYRNNSNRSYRSYLPIWSVATFLLCLPVGNVVATTTSDTAAVNINNNVETTTGGGVVSLKLTPRHVEMDRRRRERKLIVEDDHVKKEEEESSSSSIRRREEAMQVGALFEVSFCRRRIVRHSNIYGCFVFFLPVVWSK